MAGDPYLEEHWQERLQRVSAETRKLVSASRRMIEETRQSIAFADETLHGSAKKPLR